MNIRQLFTSDIFGTGCACWWQQSSGSFDLVPRLEMMGKENQISGAWEIFVSLSDEMERLKEAVAEYLEGEQS